MKFTYHTDIIQVPDDIATSIRKYQKAFDKWLYNKDIDHEYWVCKDGKKVAVSFDTNAFVEYLNIQYLEYRNDKVRIVQENVSVLPDGIQILYF